MHWGSRVLRRRCTIGTLVRETGENFKSELEGNQSNLKNELENTRELKNAIGGMMEDLPELRKHPAEFRARVGKLGPSFYFLSSSRWDAALSTGAMAHISTEEVARYAGSNIRVRSYSQLEAEALPAYMQLEAYFEARPGMTPTEVDSLGAAAAAGWICVDGVSRGRTVTKQDHSRTEQVTVPA